MTSLILFFLIGISNPQKTPYRPSFKLRHLILELFFSVLNCLLLIPHSTSLPFGILYFFITILFSLSIYGLIFFLNELTLPFITRLPSSFQLTASILVLFLAPLHLYVFLTFPLLFSIFPMNPPLVYFLLYLCLIFLHFKAFLWLMMPTEFQWKRSHFQWARPKTPDTY